MPDAVRVVSKSLSHLRHLGFNDTAALMTIVMAARQASGVLRLAGITDLRWLESIADTAERAMPFPLPSTSDHQEREHADGAGGRTGRTA